MSKFNINMDGKNWLFLTFGRTIENRGLFEGRAGVKVTLIEQKSIIPFLGLTGAVAGNDVEWFQWTPLTREGGPALVINITKNETPTRLASEFSQNKAGDQTIPPGQSRNIGPVIRVPGPNFPEMREFWKKHNGAKCKVVIESIQLGLDGSFVKSLDSLTISDVLQFSFSGTTKLSSVNEPIVQIQAV